MQALEGKSMSKSKHSLVQMTFNTNPKWQKCLSRLRTWKDKEMKRKKSNILADIDRGVSKLILQNVANEEEAEELFVTRNPSRTPFIQ